MPENVQWTYAPKGAEEAQGIFIIRTEFLDETMIAGLFYEETEDLFKIAFLDRETGDLLHLISDVNPTSEATQEQRLERALGFTVRSAGGTKLYVSCQQDEDGTWHTFVYALDKKEPTLLWQAAGSAEAHQDPTGRRRTLAPATLYLKEDSGLSLRDLVTGREVTRFDGIFDSETTLHRAKMVTNGVWLHLHKKSRDPLEREVVVDRASGTQRAKNFLTVERECGERNLDSGNPILFWSIGWGDSMTERQLQILC